MSHPKKPKPPVQYSTSAIFVVTLIVAAALATWTSFGGYALICVTIAVLAVAAHVAGNSLGTKMRDKGSRLAASSRNDEAQERVDVEKHFAPTTKLEKREALGWKPYIITAIGGLIGGLIGGYALAALQWEKATLSTVLVGFVASGILFGFFTYLATTFFTVSVDALNHAQELEADKET